MRQPATTLLFLLPFVFATAPLWADTPVDLKSIHKVLILGDSITHHSPVPALAWTGDWGMAATAADKDYVHLFLAKLADAQGAGAHVPDVWIFAEGGGKLVDKVPFVDKITAYKADLALVQMGENDRDVSAAGFQQPYEKLLEAIKAGNPNVRILCSGVWGVWPTGDHTKDVIIRDVCLKYGATYADLGAVFADPATHAAAEHLYTNVGVNWHPSDAGMAAYANAFWQALTGVPAASTSTAPTAGAAISPAPAVAPASAPADVSSGPKLFEIEENWGNPLSLTWSPIPPIAQENGRNIVKLTATTPGGMTYGTRLDVSKFAGREVMVHTRVKADSISDLPNPWNGVKIMFHVVDAEGKPDYPQFRLPGGTYDWTEVNWAVKIPENTTTIDFVIGLEKVTGTVLFDPIQISTK